MLFWFLLFIGFTVIWPGAARYLAASTPFSYGSLLGVGVGVINVLRAEGRASLHADFAALMLKNLREQRTDVRRELEANVNPGGDE